MGRGRMGQFIHAAIEVGENFNWEQRQRFVEGGLDDGEVVSVGRA